MDETSRSKRTYCLTIKMEEGEEMLETVEREQNDASDASDASDAVLPFQWAAIDR